MAKSIDKITIDDEISCIAREIAMRKKVYPKWIETRRMTRDKANHEVLTMEKTLRRLKGIKAKESNQTQIDF